MSKKQLLIITFCCLIITGVIISYYFFSLEPIDKFFYNLIISLKNPIVTNIFKLFTYLGGVCGTICLIILVTIINKKRGWYFLLNIVCIISINFVLKNIFMRPRPTVINMIDENGFSFPSGHTMVCVAAYGLLFYYLYHSRKSKYCKFFYGLIISLALFLIPISRVYLGVHYFSDILSGACFSIIWLIIYVKFLQYKGI